MPDRKQLNFKLDEAASERFDRLMVAMTRVLGFAPSQAQLVSLALVALEEKHSEDSTSKKPRKS